MGDLLLVVAKYEFSPALSDKNMLELKPGDKMVVLDKVCKYFPRSFQCPPALDTILSCLFFSQVSGNNQGWWKAIKDNKVGYIPKDFVQPVENGDVEP